MSDVIHAFMFVYYLSLSIYALIFIAHINRAWAKNRLHAAIIAALICFGWLIVPWIAFGCYQLHLANMNLIHNRDSNTIIKPAAPIEVVAPVKEKP